MDDRLVYWRILSACGSYSGGHRHRLELVMALLSSLEDDPGYVNYCKFAMHESCAFGNVELVEYLLHLPCSDSLINCTSENGETPLHVASRMLNMEVHTCYRLCNHEITILQTGACPLHWFVEPTEYSANLKKIAHLLLTVGDCDPNIRSLDGYTPLMVACKLVNHQIMEFMICTLISSKKCNPNVQNDDGNTALHLATAMQCCQTSIEVLVRCERYKPDLVNDLGETPLHCACSKLNVEAVTVLLKEGRCDVNALTKRGQTPLHLVLMSASNGQELREHITCQLLAVSNCDPHVPDAQGVTPLQIANFNRADKNIVLHLLEKGCEEEYSNRKPMIEQVITLMSVQLLHLIACKRRSRILQYILRSAYYSPDAINRLGSSNGDPLLISAVRGNNADTVEVLLDIQDCDPNVKNANADTPLIIACKMADVQVVNALLRHKRCHVGAQSKNGNTALHFAAARGCQETVRYIISEEGCSSGLTNEQGEVPLHMACKELQVQTVEVFLNNSICNVNLQTSTGQTPLHLVVAADDAEVELKMKIISLLLAIPDCDCNVKNSYGDAPLIVACKRAVMVKGYLPIIGLFLSNVKCDPNTQNVRGFTALHFAAAGGWKEIVKVLMSSGKCDPNRQTNDGITALQLATMEGHREIVKSIICHEECVLDLANKQGEDPMHMACKNLHVQTVEVFLDNGKCNVNLQTRTGQTPLHLVVAADDAEMELKMKIISLLLAIPDCNPNLRNADGDTPLIFACKKVVRTKGYIPIINAFLLSDKCNPNIPDNNGFTALHFAAAGGFEEVAKAFACSKTCRPNLANKQGKTPLHIACFKLQVKAVQMLLELRTCNVNLQANNGHTPLHMVVRANVENMKFKLEIIQLLLASPDCDPNISDFEGDTPLIIACKCVEHHVLIIRSLLSNAKCDPNIPMKNGSTALHIATWKGCQEAVKELVHCERYKPDIRNKHCETPLHIACSQLNIQTVTVLLKEGRCDVNAQTTSGQTPLHLVLTGKLVNSLKLEGTNIVLPKAPYKRELKEKIAQLLLDDPNIDPHIADANGVTSLQIAYQTNTTLFTLILERGCAEGYPKTEEVMQHAMALTDATLLHSIWLYHLKARALRCALRLPVSPAIINQIEPFSGDTPLIAAIRAECVETVDLLLDCQYCDPNVKTAVEGDTPLIVACRMVTMYDTEGYLTIIRILLSNDKCDINGQNDKGNTALHIAAKGSCQETVNALVSHERYKPDIANSDGRTPLHVACSEFNVPIVALILQNRKCNINLQTSTGQTPLHIAVGANKREPWTTMELVHLFLSHPHSTTNDTSTKEAVCQHCDLNVQNCSGDTPLHIAIKWHKCDIVGALLCSEQCEPNVQNNAGETPLHIACKLRKYDCVVSLTKSNRCNVDIPDHNGYTALHRAIYSMDSGDLSIIEHLISDNQCDLMSCDLQGNTALHIACTKAAWKQDGSMLPLIRLLLSTGKVDPQCVNNTGDTPAHYAISNKKVYQELSYFSKAQSNNPIETVVKVFVVGNAETGKSTLIKTICTEASKGRKYVPLQFRTVKGVKHHTAGIVPIPVQSRHFGNAIIYDFAGQHEYYSSHAAVLENLVLSSPPVFLVLVDLSKPLKEMSQSIAYWWSFIKSYTARSHLDPPPHVILIGSHKDIVKSEGRKVATIETKLLKTLDGLPINFTYDGFAALNCTLIASDGLKVVLTLISRTCETIRKEQHIDLRCHVLSAFLQDKFPNTMACTLADIIYNIKAVKNTLLPQSTPDLVNLLSTLTDKDRILLLKNSEYLESSWIILQRQKVYGEINGSIFAPEYFNEHFTDFAGSTGVVTQSKIKECFPQHHPDIITGFLAHLEFCFKIGDDETLRLITDNEEFSPDEEFYFFPALVQVKNPPKEKVWKSEVYSPAIKQAQHKHKYGWFYECSHPHQYLMTRFLHVLQFRLAFSFALVMEHRPSQCCPAIRRRCSVWKRGISWVNNHSIETLLEVGLQNQWMVLLMQCSAGMEVECAKLRSAVVKIILDTKEEFCPSIGMYESLLHPCNADYPFQRTDKLSLYRLKEVSKVVIERKPFAVDEEGSNSIHLVELLPFEPYTGLGELLVTQLFTSKYAQQKITDDSFQEISQTLLSGLESPMVRLKLLARGLLPQVATHLLVNQQNSPEVQCVRLMQQAQIKTYQNLEEKLSSFSIFCGRNPLVLAGLPPAVISGFTYSEHESLLEQTDDSLLGIESLLEVRTEVLSAVDHSASLGLALGLSQASKLKVIQCNWPENIAFQLTEIMAAWLQGMGNSSWRSLAKALLDPAVDCPAIARAVMEQHPQDGHPVQPSDYSEAYFEVNGAPLEESSSGDILSALVQGGYFSWFHLGLVLGLHYGTLKPIERIISHEECIAIVITKWLNQVDSVWIRGQPSWRVLARALSHPLVGQYRLANDIARNHRAQKVWGSCGSVSPPKIVHSPLSECPQSIHLQPRSPSPPHFLPSSPTSSSPPQFSPFSPTSPSPPHSPPSSPTSSSPPH